MSVRKLDQSEWQAFFDRFSREMIRNNRVDYAEIRVVSPEVGAQPETAWLPLIGITYDPKDDLLEVAVENLDHLVYHPVEIYVDEQEGRINGLSILSKDGRKEIVELR